MISSDTTIEEMCRLGLISVRAMNVCRYGEIKTLIQLLKADKFNLLKTRNCGRKTIIELDEIRENYSHYLQEQHIDVEENPVIVIEETELINAQKKIELLAPNSVVHLKG